VRRLPATVLAFLSWWAAGCTAGRYDPLLHDGGATPDQVARDEFESTVFPLYHGECGRQCHEKGLDGAPIFGDSYDDLTGYADGRLFSCDPPSSSLWVNKGVHTPGVEFSASTRATIMQWLDLWAQVSPSCDGLITHPRSAPIVPTLGSRSGVDLSLLADGLAGATLSFDSQAVADGLYLTSVRVTAGGGGLHVRAPRFESCSAGTVIADPGNAFDGVDLSVQANGSSLLGPGSLSILGWTEGSDLAVSFAEVTPLSGPTPTHDLGGACGHSDPAADAGP